MTHTQLSSDTQKPGWTLSGFGDEIHDDPVVQLNVLQALGAHHIEVRSAWGTNVVDLTTDQLDTLRRIFDANGMGVSAIASPIGKVDAHGDPAAEIARLRAAINAAHILATRYIRIFSFYRGEGVTVDQIRETVISQLRKFASIAETEGVVLLHENEKDIYGDTPERVHDLITAVNSPALRVAWDSANFVQVGVRPFTGGGYTLLRPYLEYLQIKDALAEDGTVVPAGEGDGELHATLSALRDDGYRGFASLEPHLSASFALGGYSGAASFGQAATAFASLADDLGVELR